MIAVAPLGKSFYACIFGPLLKNLRVCALPASACSRQKAKRLRSRACLDKTVRSDINPRGNADSSRRTDLVGAVSSRQRARIQVLRTEYHIVAFSPQSDPHRVHFAFPRA